MRRSEKIFLLAAVLVAGIVLAVSLASRPAPGGSVRITVDGQEHATVPLSQPQTLVIETEGGGTNTIEITEEGVCMVSANCPGQDCVQQGPVTLENYRTRPMGTTIICLPHRVVVELVDEEADD